MNDLPTGNATNIDPETVAGFGAEWSAYDQTAMSEAEWKHHFSGYFSLFPFDQLPAAAQGFDLGCGSGRWAAGVAPLVGKLHCIDPSADALAVARRRMTPHGNVAFHVASVDTMPLEDDSQDFGYSLGVLHHVPDTALAIRQCVAKLKVGAPFLVYLYYAFDNRPAWFRFLWRLSDVFRRVLSRAPFPIRRMITTAIAAVVYWPMARVAAFLARNGRDVSNFPLSAYRQYSFYTMRTDALDRFGTRLEQRFTRAQIGAMLAAAGLEDIRFRDGVPYWVACGRKARG